MIPITIYNGLQPSWTGPLWQVLGYKTVRDLCQACFLGHRRCSENIRRRRKKEHVRRSCGRAHFLHVRMTYIDVIPCPTSPPVAHPPIPTFRQLAADAFQQPRVSGTKRPPSTMPGIPSCLLVPEADDGAADDAADEVYRMVHMRYIQSYICK